MTRTTGVLALVLAGCGRSEIASEYEAQRARMTADPGPAPQGWAADGTLHMSPALVDDLMTVGVETYGVMAGETEVSGPLGVRGRVAYDMAVRRMDVSGSDRCERCVEVRTRIGGDVAYQFGPVRGTSPVRVDVVMDVRFDVEARRDASFAVTLVTQSVQDVEVTVRNLGGGVGGVINRELSAWAQQALFAQMQPIPMGTFGGPEFPIRAMTVAATDRGGATLDFLTRSPTPEPIGATTPKVMDGWQLNVSQTSLLGLAAKASLDMGAISHGVVVEPTGLRIATQSFEMDLRLWKPSGRGWWRDYTVEGTTSIEDGKIQLTSSSVVETGQSEGALLADPLAAVGESVILSSIEEGVNQSLPLAHTTQASGFDVDVAVRTVAASPGSLVVRGSLAVRKATPTATPSMTRPSPQGMTRSR